MLKIIDIIKLECGQIKSFLKAVWEEKQQQMVCAKFPIIDALGAAIRFF